MSASTRLPIGPGLQAVGVRDSCSKRNGTGGRVRRQLKTGERGGLFYQPTVVSDVTADMAFATEEIFGPVAPIFRFSTEDEAVALANATEFGLAGINS